MRNLDSPRSVAVRVLVLICLLMFLGACAVPRNQVRDVADGQGWRVRLMKFASKEGLAGRGGFEHPADISLLKLNRILAAVRYRDKNILKGKGVQPLFPKKTRALLLRPLHQALSQADPEEVVDFCFLQPKGYLMIFTRELFTSGIMFVKDGKLHLVMRTVNFLVDSYYDATKQFVGDPTRRALSMDWEFVAGPGMELVKNPKAGLLGPEYYPNWLVIDLEHEFPEPLSKRGRRGRRPASMLPEGARPVYQTRPTYPEAEPSELQPAAPASVAPADRLDDPEVRRQLDILRELYNSGAISRSTYERRKNKLLNP
jgi:hypothetical protein